MKYSKNIEKVTSKYEKNVAYSLSDAVDLVQGLKYSRFDESVDLAINLDVDPRHAEENIRLTTPLPHGTGKIVSVLVLTSGPKEKEALIINGQIVKMICANNPEDIDYTQYGITNALIIDNTGVFTNREALSRHLQAKGSSRVLLTAPGKEIPNIVYGINQFEE